MKLIVFGATGKTGQHVWRQAMELGHEVTVFTRSAAKFGNDGPNPRVVQGDVMDGSTVAEAVADQEAVIIALGSSNLRDKTTLTSGTRNIVDAMEQGGSERLIVLSAAGVGESWGQVSLPAKVIFKTLLRNIHADHSAQETVVTGSSLDWTIVRAAILKDEPPSGQYKVGNGGKVKHINRADVADFLVKQVDDPTYRKQAVSVTS